MTPPDHAWLPEAFMRRAYVVIPALITACIDRTWIVTQL
jgi:hypothetical protein